jgi:hypothetical protein
MEERERSHNAAETNAIISCAAWKGLSYERRGAELLGTVLLLLYHAVWLVDTHHTGRPAMHKQGGNEPSRPSLSEQRKRRDIMRERQLFAGAERQKTR